LTGRSFALAWAARCAGEASLRFPQWVCRQFHGFFQNCVSRIDARCIARGTGSAPDQGTDQDAFEVHKSDFDYLLGDREWRAVNHPYRRIIRAQAFGDIRAPCVSSKARRSWVTTASLQNVVRSSRPLPTITTFNAVLNYGNSYPWIRQRIARLWNWRS